MCGIIGYLGKQAAAPILLNGLHLMEYRGYDSAGMAVIEKDGVHLVRRVGRVGELAQALQKERLCGYIGIGHTRWATHGSPSERNAHPHRAGSIYLVHNGIIENHAELKSELAKEGVKFASDTDTEVLAALVSQYYEKSRDFKSAVIEALGRVDGTFGLVIMCADQPDILIGARRGSPLLLSLGQAETYLASDPMALAGHSDQVIYLEDDEVVVCQAGSYQLLGLDNQQRQRQLEPLDLQVVAPEKGQHEHFLLKEIMEQPSRLADTLRGRLDQANGTSHLGGLSLTDHQLRQLRQIMTVACGTASYAGLLGKYQLERLTGLPVMPEIGSEFRYREAVIPPHTLAVAISQSGETADTLASVRELKLRGVPTLGLVNVVGSSIAREADGGIYLHAGPEVAVASTKAFTSQVATQLLLGLYLGRINGHLSIPAGQEVVQALEALPRQIRRVLDQAAAIQAIAKRIARFNNAFYLGRDQLYPIALEGSLKLKETSYIHAEAYAAGELKHGALALIDDQALVVFLLPKSDLYLKAKSNLSEIKARGGHRVVVATDGDHGVDELAHDIIRIPKTSPWTLPIIANIPLQLLAYYVAVERGTNVDRPRNLAKSVTVE